PARICPKKSPGVAAKSVSVNVRPISIPAWSSDPPMAVPPWVSMYTNAGRVELLGARAVTRLPDREQLRETAAVARHQWCRDRIERMCERRRDPVLSQV